MAFHSSRAAAGALALGFIFSTTLLAGAKGGGLVAGIGGTVSGTLGGSASGAGLSMASLGASLSSGAQTSGSLGAGGGMQNVSSTNSANLSGASSIALSGPSGTVASGASTDLQSTTSTTAHTINTNTDGSIKSMADLEAQQRAEGTVKSVSASSITMAFANGTTRTYQFTSGAMASAFNGLVGRAVMLRSADGVHVTSLVGKSDVVRGTITAISGDTVAYASANGEMHLLALGKGGVDRLKARLGSIVVSESDDFGRTAQLAVLALKPHSILGQVTIGKVDAVGNGEVAMQVGNAMQTFAVSGATTAKLLASLKGTDVALDVPDGYHVKSLITSKTLDGLLHATGGATASGAIADVIKTSKNSATVQLRNGDVVTYTGNVAPLHLRPGASVTLTSSGAANAQLKSGTRIAQVTTSASATGVIVAQTPTMLSVQFPNGDVRSFVGDAKSIQSAVGAQAAVGPVDSVHVGVTANGHKAVLVDAKACATINAGCAAEAGIVTSVSADHASITLASGETLTLGRAQGAAKLQVDGQVIVQPLNATNVAVSSEGNAVAMVSEP